MNYTIYVLKDTVTAFDDALTPDAQSGYKKVSVVLDGLDGQGYFQRERRSPVGWLEFVSQICEIPDASKVRNRSSSFVLVIRTKSGQLCALTYGQGFLAVARDEVIKGFGLDAACRLLDSDEINEVESKGVGSSGLHKHQTASRPNDVGVFPLQRARDQVHKLGGKSPDSGLGKRFTGGTPCTISGALTPAQIIKVCERLVASVKLKPKRRLATLHPFRRLDDAKIIDKLRDRLLRALTPARCGEVGLFLPESRDWARSEQFEVTVDGNNWLSLDDLDIEEICDLINVAAIPQLKLEEVRVRGLDDRQRPVFHAKLEELAVFETDFNKKPYACKDGEWFALDQAFIDNCDRDLAHIVPTVPGYLPDWANDARESAYNNRVANADANRLLCLDTKTIQVAGRAVEPCDLLTVDGHFIHVKKWESSQTFSALMAQGENAASLIDNSQEFRDGVVAKLAKERPKWLQQPLWKKFSAGIKPAELQIVYAIVADKKRKMPSSLPFFSRLSVLEASSRLSAAFFKVRFCHIGR